MRTKDYKRAAAGDFDEDIDLTSLKPEADEGVRLEVQHERGEVVEIPQLAQITAHVERKILRLKPSDRNWLSVIKKIFAEGRRG
jgi:hypothetical protein